MSTSRPAILVLTLSPNESKSSVSNCIIPISVKLRSFDETDRAMAIAAFEAAVNQFDESEIVVTDSLQECRFPPEQIEEAKRFGDEWYGKISECADKVDPSHHKLTVSRWNKYRNESGFQQAMREINDRFEEKPSAFRTTVKETVNKYFDQRRNNEVDNEANARSEKYVLEECAVFNLWKSRAPSSCRYLLYYQGNVNDAIVFLNQWDGKEHYQIAEYQWNDLDMFTRYANGANYRYVVDRLDEAYKQNWHQQTSLVPYFNTVKTLTRHKDGLAHARASSRLFSFFLSRGQSMQSSDKRRPILSSAQDNFASAFESCEQELTKYYSGHEGPFDGRLKFLRLLLNPPAEAQDLCGLYGTIIFNYCSLLGYTLAEYTVAERKLMARQFSQLCIAANKNIAWLAARKMLWLIPGSYYLSAILYAKSKDFKQALYYYEKTMNPRLEWENVWYGKVKNRLNIASVYRHLAYENNDKRINAKEYLDRARAFLNLALAITTEANEGKVTDEYRTHTDIEFALICLFEMNRSLALAHLVNVITIYSPYQHHSTDSLSVLTKAYYLAAREMLEEKMTTADLATAKKYCQAAEDGNKQLYSKKHPYHRQVVSLKKRLTNLEGETKSVNNATLAENTVNDQQSDSKSSSSLSFSNRL